MTNIAALANAHWSKRVTTGSSDYKSHLIRQGARVEEVRALFEALTNIRGAHSVRLRRNTPDYVNGVMVPSLWFTISVAGTFRATKLADRVMVESGLIETDRNADHDHARCIANAKTMGVPPAYAHTPESYLSA